MHPAPEQITGRPHLGGIDVGLREHAAAQQHGNFLGVDLVVFGLAPVDGLHIEGMAEDKGHAFAGTQVGEPVPGKDAFDGDDEILPIGGNGLEKRLWAGLHIAVHQDLAVLVQDTDVHGAGMQVDAAVKLVLFGVESHEVSSSS